MHDIKQIISELEEAQFAIRLRLNTLNGEADPRQLHLFEPLPEVELSKRKGHLCILVKKHSE